MFLGAYDFDGVVDDLLPAYERLRSGYPEDALLLHVCVERPGGITVYDACPSREVFESFSTSAEFQAAVQAAGLPLPRVSPVGEVRSTVVREGAIR